MRHMGWLWLCAGGMGCAERIEDTVEPDPIDEETDTADEVVDSADTGVEDRIHHDPEIQDIWDHKCGSCHLGDHASGHLNLTDAYDKIVGVRSSDVPSMSLVEPGSPQESYLWHKLAGSQALVGGEGVDMPKEKVLSDEDRDRIDQWILDGALR